MLKKLNLKDELHNKFKWKGSTTDYRIKYEAYYNDIRELRDLFIENDLTSNDDIDNYIIENYGLEEYEKAYQEAVENDADNYEELYDKMQAEIDKAENEMTDEEIENMLSSFDGMAYYQRFIDLEEEEE